jgi:2,3-bisphosphoglycerate-dependent phosphoglycerate mutase
MAEWDRGSSSYIPVEELKAANDPVWRSLAAGALHELGVDGPQFQARVVSAIDQIALDHPDQVVAAVCHGGVLNAYLSFVLGLDRMLFFPPDYTGISRVEVGRIEAGRPGKRLLHSLNETPHLPR